MNKLVYGILLFGWVCCIESADAQVKKSVNNGVDSVITKGYIPGQLHDLATDQIFPDRIRDLVIINDVSENAGKDWRYIGFPFSNELVNIPLMFKLLYALQEEQFVLTTKSLFYQVQLMAGKWDALALSQSEFLKLYYHAYDHYIPRPRSTFLEQENREILQRIEFAKLNTCIESLNTFYEAFLRDVHIGNEYFNDAIRDMFSTFSEQQAYQILHLFLYKTLYAKFLTQHYQCKEVDQHFLLFIPKKLQDEVRGIRQDSLKNLYVGLQYRGLKDYDYNRLYSLNKSAMLRSAPQYENIGEYLLRALERLLPHYSDTKHTRPQFNIFLTGHGFPEYVAAMHKNVFNRMIKLFQDRLFMKSLTIDTCSVGGKQFKDVYNIQDMYTSQMLESVTYTVLFVGSFYAPTMFQLIDFNKDQFADNFEHKELKLRNIFKNLFAYLHENPPSYYKAVKFLENVFVDDKSINKTYISNYVSIKFPHTSWIVPSDYDKRVQKLSRVEVANFYQKDFVLSPSKKVVLLGTEVIPSYLVVNSVVKSVNDVANNIPVMLPVKYTAQGYRIAQLRLPHVLVPLLEGKIKFASKILRHMFLALAYKLEEQIFILIDTFVVGNKEFKNVCIDMSSGDIFFNTDDNLAYRVKFDETGSFTTGVGQEYQKTIDAYISYFDSDLFQNKLEDVKKIFRFGKKITDMYDKPTHQVVQKSRQQYEAISEQQSVSTPPLDTQSVIKQKRRVHNPYSWNRKNVNN